ncbi:TraB/GumN family protein [Novosphingobium sp.]|uniref:TraB/GumN family protein n=1 Tax=Novosphingobium sp. TaxID=1874826 RepID=UPI0035B22E0F
MSSSLRKVLIGAVLVLLAACQRPEPVHPALWQVDGPGGQRAWLFGTIHALPRPVDWRSPRIDAALGQADRIVLEVASIDDDQATAQVFARLAAAPQAAPLRDRVPPKARADYARYVEKYGAREDDLRGQDTWAAALVLAQLAQADLGSDSANGVDRAVKAAAEGRPVEEFEGADAQLRIFDALPETEQRDLLAMVVQQGSDPRAEAQRLEQAWAKGDVAALTRETQGGLLADPELRAALLVGRNRAWTARLETMLRQGQRPFVAVGAAHLAGPDGLPAMLAARGYRVSRVQ